MTTDEIMYGLEDNDFTMALKESVSFTNLQSDQSAQPRLKMTTAMYLTRFQQVWLNVNV